MEAIFMDGAWNMTRIIDAFSSFIWTDRYIGCGDFELRYPMTDSALEGIQIGTYLSNGESDRCMVVEGVEILTSVEEGNVVIIKGRSLESILDRKIVLDKTILTGSFQSAILRLLNANIIFPSNPNRQTLGLSFKYSTDPAIESLTVDATVEAGTNLYDAIYDLCSEKHVGFRILPADNALMVFELYSGQNRSYDQDKIPWVVFSPKFENIQETDLILSVENLRNVIYAESTYTERVENADGEVEDVEKTIRVVINDEYSGLDRREIYIQSNITPERINKEDFGKPEDRVDISRYADYVVVNRRDDEFDQAVDEWYQNRWQELGYSPDHPVYGGPVGHHNVNYNDYVDRDWVIRDEVGYNMALAEAQRQIDAEYQAAVENSEAMAEEMIRLEALSTLMEYSKISTFDGEVAPSFQYILGRDYNLGDIVQIVNEFGIQAVTRVTSVLYSEETGSGFMVRPSFESDDTEVFDL